MLAYKNVQGMKLGSESSVSEDSGRNKSQKYEMVAHKLQIKAQFIFLWPVTASKKEILKTRRPSSTDGRRDRAEGTAKVCQKEAQRGRGEAQDRAQSYPGAKFWIEILVLNKKKRTNIIFVGFC